MPDKKRNPHPNFLKYVKFITQHKAYKWLFFSKNSDGSIRRVVAGKSEDGQKRRAWWDKQCQKNWIKIEAWCYKKIADLIHPTKKHTCQICWKELSIYYVYPTQNIIKKLNSIGLFIKPYALDIYQIIDQANIEQLNKIAKIFGFNGTVNKQAVKLFIDNNYVKKYEKNKKLSPWVMSNSPDRFDWFHSDWACCRSESDKWRHKTNLTRYAQDRRVYENWSDWNWKMADRLMWEFRNHNISADHIWPISLWFCHRPKFKPMTQAQNSAKNNRMSFSDIQELIWDEKKWETVISWHSKYVWDKIKWQIKNDKDALKASKLLRENLHNILMLFSLIDESWFGEFLKRYLNLEYSYYDYKFIGFDPKTWNYEDVKTIRLDNKNQKNNADRYTRIAFETLEDYRQKGNRRVWHIRTKELVPILQSIIKNIKENNMQNAHKEILHYIVVIGDILLSKYWY